jgi:tetratricopeptide (TPR) repeat protein
MNQITIKFPQKTIVGSVSRLAIYIPYKVLEVLTPDQSTFYILDFKDKIIAGKDLKNLQKKTFLEQAFLKGTVFKAPHPIISAYLRSKQTITIPKLDQLFTNLQNHFSLQEIAYAATCMDHFLEKEQIINMVRKIYDHFHQIGQLKQAYKIIMMLNDFAPEQEWVKQTANHHQFEKYKASSQENPLSLLESNDKLIGHYAYTFLNDKKYIEMLHSTLNDQCRWVEQIALHYHLLNQKYSIESYPNFIKLLHTHLTLEEVISVLQELYQEIPSLSPLKQDILQSFLDMKRYEEPFRLLINEKNPLDLVSNEIVENIIVNLDPSTLLEYLSKINHLLVLLFTSSSDKKIEITRNVITQLLREKTIADVKEWFNPLHQCEPLRPMKEDLEYISQLVEDPEGQLELGKLFYQYDLFEQALECFSWEAELNPLDPSPVRWLCNVYKKKGMEHEAEAYKQLSIQLLDRVKE